jgi:hypothetical protein
MRCPTCRSVKVPRALPVISVPFCYAAVVGSYLLPWIGECNLFAINYDKRDLAVAK